MYCIWSITQDCVHQRSITFQGSLGINKADVLLYEHFNQTFWRKVKSQYDNFWSEVRLLKQKSHAMAKECLLPGEHKDERRKNIATKLILNPRVGHDMEHLCRELVKDEDGYLTYFRDIQLRERWQIVKPDMKRTIFLWFVRWMIVWLWMLSNFIKSGFVCVVTVLFHKGI